MPQRFKTKIDGNGRVCTICNVYKLRSGYYTSSQQSTGYFPRCKLCAMKYGYSVRSYKGSQEVKQMMKQKWGVGKVSGFILPKQ